MAHAVVIGAGVMGLASARALRQHGWQVTVLDRARPGRGASWASAGIIGATVRDESDPTLRLRTLSEALWPAYAAALTDESGLDPEYRPSGCLFLATSDDELNWLGRVAARREDGELLADGPAHALEPSLGPRVRGALRVAGGSVEPRRLVRALELAARRAGAVVRGGVEVRALSSADGHVTGVETADGPLAADLVVLAAGAWASTIGGLRPQPPIRPQRGQILALDQAGLGVQHVLLLAGDPYFVPRADGRLVVGATREEAGWDASLTAGGVAWLLNRAQEVLPGAADCPLAELWTGFRPVSADGLPLIGRGGLDGLFFLTGHGPSGIAPLPGSVALLSALIAQQPPPVAPAPFDPLRYAAA